MARALALAFCLCALPKVCGRCWWRHCGFLQTGYQAANPLIDASSTKAGAGSALTYLTLGHGCKVQLSAGLEEISITDYPAEW